MKWLREFLGETPFVRTDNTDKTTLNDFRRTKDKTIPHKTGTPPTDKTDKSPSGEIEARIFSGGFSIAIDHEDGSAHLLLRESDAELLRDVATVSRAFEIELTPKQRVELTDTLNYYESLIEPREESK